jgi:hypothetical protein
MLWACCAFAAGMLWAKWFWAPPRWLLVGIVLCGTGALVLLLRRVWLFGSMAVFATVAMLGALSWEGACSRPVNFDLRSYATNQELEITGTAVGDATVGAGMFGA